jgi:hypothetical protein
VVHERLSRDDQHHGPPLAARRRVLDRRSERARLGVDGSGALRGLRLDVAPYGGLLAPAVVVAVVVLVLFADAGQRCARGRARRRPPRSRLLAHRVKQLLRAGRPADDALGARQHVPLVFAHHARRHGVARAPRPARRLPVRLLAAAVLAIAQVVVGRGILVVFARRPHPRCKPGGRNNNSQGQRHPVAERVPAAGRVLAAVVAVVVEAHDSWFFIAW